jgi:hypothetical protein
MRVAPAVTHALYVVRQCSLSESLVTARATDILEGMILRGFTTVRDCGK